MIQIRSVVSMCKFPGCIMYNILIENERNLGYLQVIFDHLTVF